MRKEGETVENASGSGKKKMGNAGSKKVQLMRKRGPEKKARGRGNDPEMPITKPSAPQSETRRDGYMSDCLEDVQTLSADINNQTASAKYNAAYSINKVETRHVRHRRGGERGSNISYLFRDKRDSRKVFAITGWKR